MVNRRIIVKIIQRRIVWYIISLLIIIPGLFSLATQGLNLGIDFTGGSMIQVRFEQAVSSEQIRNVLDEYGLGKSVIQASANNTFLLRTKTLSQAQQNKILGEFKSKYGKMELLRNDVVGPVVGQELTQKAIYALIFASLLIVAYITFRFEFKFAIAAIIALLHDAFVVIGVFSLLQIEVDSTFVAAVLTILGYSINDTIVIFDRIRENMRITKKMPLDELIDNSIMQTLARSINTILAVIFVLASLLVFGGETIRVFALALLVGVISGGYSSIFNASPLWYDFRRIFNGRKTVQKA
jgi:preprotein translocase subunit SecF